MAEERKSGRPIAASQRPTGGDKTIATGKRQYFRRKKVDRICIEKIDYIDYKDVRLLSSFISERGKIIPRRITGLNAQNQRRVAEAIQQARNIALLPFAGGLNMPRYSRDRDKESAREQPREQLRDQPREQPKEPAKEE
jgi:small subunit ribosomal protein S18